MSIVNKLSLSYLTESDSKFKLIIDRYGLPPSWSRPEGFETLCKIILEQQVSLESGKAAFEKLSACLPHFVPSAILKLTIEDMRKATISRQKAGYILGLANLMEKGLFKLRELKTMDYDPCLVYLTKVKGIGPWTAEVYMLFALQFPDIYPKGDIALINTIKELWAVNTALEALNLTERWSPHRSAACFLLWHYYLSKRGRTSPG